MKAYQDITITDGEDALVFRTYRDALNIIHRNSKNGNYAVSFPEFKSIDIGTKKLSLIGRTMRVFADSEEELDVLGLISKTKCASVVSLVPSDTKGHVVVSSMNVVRNMERVTRRYAKRMGISLEQAKLEQIESYAEKNGISIEESKFEYENRDSVGLPHISMKSRSNGHNFSIFINQRGASECLDGNFCSYGLSSSRTVPHW